MKHTFTRKLVAGQDAMPLPKQHTIPCADCPFGRESLPGWTGTMPPEEWISGAHGEMEADCHAVSNQQCAGLAIYRANVCKAVRDPDALRLPADPVRVFATPAEFLQHHKRKRKAE